MAKSNYGFFSENKTFSNSPAAPCVVINCFFGMKHLSGTSFHICEF